MPLGKAAVYFCCPIVVHAVDIRQYMYLCCRRARGQFLFWGYCALNILEHDCS